MLCGSIVALVTPMTTSGAIAWYEFINLIKWHKHSGSNGIVIAGTTGEGATLTERELTQLIITAVHTAGDAIPIIANTGCNSTYATIQRTKMAAELGVRAALVVTPYYNKPAPEGLYQHYLNIAEASSIPIILYNVPSRTASDLSPDLVIRLSQLPNIIGIKEASGDARRAQTIMAAAPADFVVYSGDDEQNLAMMQAGAKGIISVTSNIVPLKMRAYCDAALAGNYNLATTIHNELLALHLNLFLTTNPMPVKWAMQRMGLISDGIRLPLTALPKLYHDKLLNALYSAGVVL